MSAAEPVSERQRTWISALSKLVRPLGADSAERALLAMLPMLADLPEEAFGRTSLEAVARAAGRRVPTYAVIREALSAWCREQRGATAPAPATGDDSRRAGWTAEDWSWFRYWERRRAEAFPTVEGAPTVQEVRAHVASLIRTHSPRAWAYIAAGGE